MFKTDLPPPLECFETEAMHTMFLSTCLINFICVGGSGNLDIWIHMQYLSYGLLCSRQRVKCKCLRHMKIPIPDQIKGPLFNILSNSSHSKDPRKFSKKVGRGQKDAVGQAEKGDGV